MYSIFQCAFCTCCTSAPPFPPSQTTFLSLSSSTGNRIPNLKRLKRLFNRPNLATVLCPSELGVEGEGREPNARFSKETRQPVRFLRSYRQTPILRHPFFRKQCYSLKYVLVAPLKNFKGLSKIGIYLILKSSVQF
jgi:hypothetical protein